MNNESLGVLSVKKNYKKDFNKEVIKRFANKYEFWNEGINKFILFLRKGVYPYQYMDSWERNAWIVGKDLMKHHCPIKKFFIVV